MTPEKKAMLGVIGGLGPIATAYFMELVIRMTDAVIDQEHIEMLIYNCPSVPDRTGYLLGKSDKSPLPRMIDLGKRLQREGATSIAIPCITAHCFHEELVAAVKTPIIHAVKETVLHLKENGVHGVGIMATDGTIATGIFARELEREGLVPIVPSEAMQRNVMHLIYDNIKANRAPEMDRFNAAAAELRAKGAEAIILGCTELSLIKRDYPIGAGFIDAMEVLARRAVLECGGKLKEEYRCLISK